MDEALRSAQHALRSRPGDVELARRYRHALLRQREPGWSAELDRLQGVVCQHQRGEIGPRHAPDPIAWRRVGADPLLLPAPPGDALNLRWEARGRLLLAGSAALLVETPSGALQAHEPATGAVLWRVEPELADEADDLHEEDERLEQVGWAAAPWGAARVAALLSRAPHVRRVGRYSPRGRTTQRAVVDHGETGSQASLQLVLPGLSWAAPPEELRYTAAHGEPLADSGVCLEDWSDQLLALSLDLQSRQLAVRWRDLQQDWELLSVLGGGELATSLGPAGWSAPAPDDPFTPGPAEPGDRLALDGAELVLEGGALWTCLPGGARRRWGWDPAAQLEGRRLRLGGPPHPAKEAGLVLVDELVLLQAGDEALSVWGQP